MSSLKRNANASAGTTSENVDNTTAGTSFLTEDLWAVIIGGIITGAILLFAIASPEFKFPGSDW